MRTILWLDTRRPAADVLSLAAAAEAAGWDGLRIGDDPGGCECWALAGAVAAAVPRLRLDVVVDPNRGRHPAAVAKLAATVDQLSGGRLLLGFLAATGAEGQARLSEAARVVKSLAGGGPATWRGQFYRLQDAPLDPPTVQQPFPLLLVGGTATVAGAWADHWSLGGTLGEVATQVAALRVACAEVGRARAPVTVSATMSNRAAPAGGRDLKAAYAEAGAAELVISETAAGSDPQHWAELLTT